jgi:hypothetical protein
MKKVAFFVEGLTEQFFLQSCLAEIFGLKKIVIETRSMSGGSKSKTNIVQISTTPNSGSVEYYALIINCNGGESVKSYILDRRDTLIAAEYSKIIGLLDVYPKFKRDEIDKYEKGLYFKTPQKDLEIKFILSIMEIETWFLAEHSHFERIDPLLNVNLISASLGFNPQTDNMELRDEPANDLSNCYKLVGKTYNKKTANINRTVNAIDYSKIYLDTLKSVTSLNELIVEIEKMFE